MLIRSSYITHDLTPLPPYVTNDNTGTDTPPLPSRALHNICMALLQSWIWLFKKECGSSSCSCFQMHCRCICIGGEHGHIFPWSCYHRLTKECAWLAALYFTPLHTDIILHSPEEVASCPRILCWVIFFHYQSLASLNGLELLPLPLVYVIYPPPLIPLR